MAASPAPLVGAWLGYQVPHAPGLGAVTAIVGATLAANLGLIALDVAAPVTADEPAGAPHRPRRSPAPA